MVVSYFIGFLVFFCRIYFGKIICFCLYLVVINLEDLWVIYGYFFVFFFNYDDFCLIEGFSNDELFV